MASAAIKHNFLNSQGPPEWGLIVAGPFRLLNSQLYTPGDINRKTQVFNPGLVDDKVVLFIPGKKKGEVV